MVENRPVVFGGGIKKAGGMDTFTGGLLVGPTLTTPTVSAPLAESRLDSNLHSHSNFSEMNFTPLILIIAAIAIHHSEVNAGAPPVDKIRAVKLAPPVGLKSDAEVKGEGKEKVKKGEGEVEENVAGGGEECDPANRCIEEKSKLVACLRVPGKDSLDLSLLIENKGKGSLDVTIVAPSFVKLKQTTVQLRPMENKKVKVSVQDGANDTIIVLKAGDGNCSLNFRNMIPNSVRNDRSTLFGYTGLSARSSLLGIFVAASMLACLVLLLLKYRHMKHQEGSPKYQKMDMELAKTEVGLPVSSGGKKEADNDDEADGWDDGSWGDNWDEEAAPVTPSNSVQNPSSKGLASRKSNKDGWKD